MRTLRVMLLVVSFLLGFTFAVGAQTATAVTPSITVQNQAVVNNTVTVQQVNAAQAGWLDIHADANGQPGPVIGHTAVVVGTNTNVKVTIDPTTATPTLYAMLHVDAGATGTYEFPGADVPVQVNGQIVVEPFQVTLPTTTAVVATTGTPAATTVAGTATAAATATTVATATLAATTTPVVSATSTPASTLPTTGADRSSFLSAYILLIVGMLIIIGGVVFTVTRRR